MHIHLRRVAFWVGESDFVALVHQGANRNRKLVEIVARAGINLAIFQGQAAPARDQPQNFSFCCHLFSSLKSNLFPESLGLADTSYELLFRGSSFALTYSSPSGPIAVTCVMYSLDFAQWKWDVLPGRTMTLPGGYASSFSGLNCSPRPM